VASTCAVALPAAPVAVTQTLVTWLPAACTTPVSCPVLVDLDPRPMAGVVLSVRLARTRSKRSGDVPLRQAGTVSEIRSIAAGLGAPGPPPACFAAAVGAAATTGAARLAGIRAASSPIANEVPAPAKAIPRADFAARRKSRIDERPLSQPGQ